MVQTRETEIEKVVGCARRGEVEKVNNRTGAKFEKPEKLDLGEKVKE